MDFSSHPDFNSLFTLSTTINTLTYKVPFNAHSMLEGKKEVFVIFSEYDVVANSPEVSLKFLHDESQDTHNSVLIEITKSEQTRLSKLKGWIVIGAKHSSIF